MSTLDAYGSSKAVRFGVYELDLKAGELRKQGFRLKVSEQPLQLLAMLLEKPGEVVSREELRNRLWREDTFVDFDHGLNNAVMRLREVLGDSSETPRFIETVPRRGYRFIAHLDELKAGAAGSPPISPTGKTESPGIVATARVKPQATARKRWYVLPRFVLLGVGVTALVAISSEIAIRYARGIDSLKAKSRLHTALVVLPLENVSGDKDQEYFADGLTDDLIANLAKIRSLRVISRSTAMAYKGNRKPLSQIARELNVDAVVEGTVLRAGDRVRITAELVQVSTDHHLWADTYESPIGDVLALQNRVSSAIVDEIRLNLKAEDRERLAKNPAVRPEAYESYLKGRYYWNKRSDEGFRKAIAFFEDATKKDPQYALAYAGLADCYGVIGSTILGTVPAAEAEPKAKAAAARALEIDPSLAEAQTSLATAKFNYDWDWPGAAAGFKRAIELNPSYATAYQRYSLYLAAMGRFQESFEQINKARELDPLSISINWSLGWRLYLSRQYDRAIEQLQNTIDMDPSYELAHLTLGQAYAQKRDYARALPELQKAAELSRGIPLMASALAYGYALGGNRREAEKLVQALIADSAKHYVSPYYIAIVYAGLGNSRQAMDWLEKAYADHSNGLVFLSVEPELDSLRSNPRFKILGATLGLPN
jgi:TolB-like protein/DNA-binding winged helix-turn-helix (wHTH) protein/Tfp pilus assembly protein PilF